MSAASELVPKATAGVRGRAPQDGPVLATRSGRRVLDRRKVVTGALELIDEHGVDAFSMRRLGAHLGVEAMAVYRYVSGREDLLDRVVKTLVDELTGDAEVWATADDGWQDYLVRLADGVRRIALAHPGAFLVLATRPTTPSWSRPPLQSLSWVESFVDALIGAGFSPEETVAAYREYTSLLLGHLLLEVTEGERPVRGGKGLASTRHPGSCCSAMSLLETGLRQSDATMEFEDAVTDFLRRFEELLRRPPRSAGRHRPSGSSSS